MSDNKKPPIPTGHDARTGVNGKNLVYVALLLFAIIALVAVLQGCNMPDDHAPRRYESWARNAASLDLAFQAHKKTCERCEGTGIIVTGDGTELSCPDCKVSYGAGLISTVRDGIAKADAVMDELIISNRKIQKALDRLDSGGINIKFSEPTQGAVLQAEPALSEPTLAPVEPPVPDDTTVELGPICTSRDCIREEPKKVPVQRRRIFSWRRR